jgi:hypothetical protein
MGEEFIEDIIAETSVVTPTEDIVEDPIKEPEKVVEEPDVKEKPAVKETQAAEVTIEDLATQIGWNPNYKGADAIDAATYILKSREIQDTMKDHNVDLKNQLLNVQNSVDALKEHNERVYKAEVKRMQAEINALKEQKRKAVELADVDEVDKIDQQIDDIKKDLTTPTPKSKESSNPVYDAWIKDNQWYLTDPEMANFAETVAEQYKGAPLERVYSLIRQKVAEVFPDRFESPAAPANKTKAKPVGPASPVEGVKNSAGQKFTKADLTPDQMMIMNQFKNQGIMTEEQYIADIAKMQEG